MLLSGCVTASLFVNALTVFWFDCFQKFISRLFGWNKEKAREKLLTYFTAYDLMALKTESRSYEQSSQPEKFVCCVAIFLQM